MSFEIILAWATLICGMPNENCEQWVRKCLVREIVQHGDPDLAFEHCAESLPVELIYVTNK